MPGVGVLARSLRTNVFHSARKGLGNAVTMTVSSMSEMIPKLASGSMTWILVSAVAAEGLRRTTVCHPGVKVDSRTTSTSPPVSACTV